jgi:hypothetical protein
MATSPKFDPFEQPMSDLSVGAVVDHAEACACDLVWGDTAAHVYNEEAFRYFLEIERKRSEISNRPFLLLLLDLKKRAASTDIGHDASDKLFAALALCLRETDFVGWYRAHAVIGAVLTQHGDSVGPDVQQAVRTRVVDVITGKVPRDVANRVQVRVYQVPPVGQGFNE